MKKLSIALLICFVSVLFVGCSTKFTKEAYASYVNLAENAVYYNTDNSEQKSFKLQGNTSKSIIVDLNQITKFDTIVFNEKKSKITSFSIELSNDNITYSLVYRNDTIDAMRVCYLGAQEARYIKVTVLDFSDDYNLKDIAVYQTDKQDKELRVFTYLVMDNVNENIDVEALRSVTDIILFKEVTYTKEGNLIVSDTYAEKLAIVRNAIGDRDIRILADIYMPYGNDNEDCFTLFNKYSKEAAGNTIAFLEQYNLDGVDIDFEYPYGRKQWKYYNNFLEELIDQLGDKLLSIASSGWSCSGFSKKVVNGVDYIQVMNYDLFDKNGYHSTFYTTAYQTQEFIKAGFAKEKLNIGLPFYSRPLDAFGYWGDYSSESNGLTAYDNLATFDTLDHDGNPMTTDRYFNGFQIIKDKTAYAIDMGFGGLMIWHFSCDRNYSDELSLFKAISTTKEEKLIK